MKVSELKGEELAYWVAAALTKRGVMLDGVAHHHDGKISVVGSHYRPDTNWSQCGELIEAFDIEIWSVGSNKGARCHDADGLHLWTFTGEDEKMNICRAVVASVYGEEDEC